MSRRTWTGRPRRNEFAPVSCELLVALSATKLTDRAHRVLLAVLACSYGRYRDDTTLTRAELATLTGLDHSNVSRAITELEQRGIVAVDRRGRGKRDRIMVRKTYRLWDPPTELDRAAESTFRCVPSGREIVHEHEPAEPIDRSGYQHGAKLSTDTVDRVEGHAEIVHEQFRPRVKRGSENEERLKKVYGDGSIAHESAGARAAAAAADPLTAEERPAMRPAAQTADRWTAEDPPPAAPNEIPDRRPARRPRPPITADVEQAVERLLLALPRRQQFESRRNFFDLAYRGASEADFHDARAAIAACEPALNPAGFAYRCIVNRLSRRASARGQP